MPRASQRAHALHARSVFINCPFDEEYLPLFQAITFCVLDCGFIPRSALEEIDSADTRIEKIIRLMDGCRYGIHDISRTELDPTTGVPRFNMPFELGIFLGLRHRPGRGRAKRCLVFDRDAHRFRTFLSDISGQDVSAHRNRRDEVIRRTRDWLRVSSAQANIPGPAVIQDHLAGFELELPALAAAAGIAVQSLIFADFVHLAREWLRSAAP